MKRFCLYVCMGAMMLAMAGCGQKETSAPTTAAPVQTTAAATEAPTTAAPTEAPTTAAPTEAPTTAAPEATESKKEEGSESGTPAQVLLKDFMDRMNAGEYASTAAIAEDLVNNEIIEFGPAVMPLEGAGYLNGFTEEIDGFSDGTMFGPMIGSIPFIGYVFEVDGDVDAFVKQLKDKHDLRWNICTAADEMVCEAYGNTVLFIMAPKSFEE